jgi:4-amino-4-deoxy-L-arabinose transferase-like glycosyltransferase
MHEHSATTVTAEPLNAPRWPVNAAAASPSRAWLGAALALFTLAWFASLGTRSLIHSDEGRYAALALEMARSGDWITPRLNGLLYFEKPALPYWIGALSFRWFGVTEFSARLWPGLAGFLSVLMVGFSADRLWGREAGVRALAIAGSSTWIVVNSHLLTLDAGLTLFLTLALCAVLLAECGAPSPPARRRWIWLAWAAMAGAVMSKGLVGVLIPGCTLLLASLWQRDFGLWRRLHWGSGLAIFLALAAPWFVLVSVRNPGFAEFFFIHEHFARYLTQVHRREGAWWYYVPLLLAGLLPWTGGLPWLLRGYKSSTGRAQVTARSLLIAWSAFVLVFFSASGSKLPSYILPMFPALALLLTLQLRDAGALVLRWHLLVPALAWAVLALASSQAARFASAPTPPEVLAPLAAAARAGALVFLAGAALACWCLGRRQVTAAVLSLALGHFAAATLLMQAHDTFGQLKSAAPVAAALRPLIDEQTPVFAVRSYDHTLPFYLGRNVVLVDYVDEFEFGQQREPQKWIPTLDAFVARWHSLPQAAAYMTRETWRELDQRGLPMRLVFEDARRLVVIKP